jgi:PAS domain S-box-containing protein
MPELGIRIMVGRIKWGTPFLSIAPNFITEQEGMQAMDPQRILIVYDEMVIAKDLEAKLIGMGYEVAGIARGGREALALTAQVEPNLVLMDLALESETEGISAADEIRRRWRFPVIFLTADADEATLRRARVAGPFGYVVRPFAKRELRMNIEMALYQVETAERTDELEDRFFAVSIDMLCFLDFNGYFKRLNPAWEKTLGFTRQELQSKPFIEFVHPDDRQRTLDQNGKVKGGGQALSFENRYLCKDGSYKWLHWNAAPDFDHRVIYSAARDITERKRAEEEREKLLKDLQAALAEVKTLQQILPICSYCRKIRNDENYWETVDAYVMQHTNTKFSHSICPNCYAKEVQPLLDDMESK